MTIQRHHVGKRLADMVVHGGTIYLPDMADFAAMNAVWEAWIVPGHPPARATVQAKLAASGYKIEIQVIAAQ